MHFQSFANVGDAPLRVPQNGGVYVIIGGTHRGASPTQPQESNPE